MPPNVSPCHEVQDRVWRMADAMSQGLFVMNQCRCGPRHDSCHRVTGCTDTGYLHSTEENTQKCIICILHTESAFWNRSF